MPTKFSAIVAHFWYGVITLELFPSWAFASSGGSRRWRWLESKEKYPPFVPIACTRQEPMNEFLSVKSDTQRERIGFETLRGCTQWRPRRNKKGPGGFVLDFKPPYLFPSQALQILKCCLAIIHCTTHVPTLVACPSIPRANSCISNEQRPWRVLLKHVNHSKLHQNTLCCRLNHCIFALNATLHSHVYSIPFISIHQKLVVRLSSREFVLRSYSYIEKRTPSENTNWDVFALSIQHGEMLIHHTSASARVEASMLFLRRCLTTMCSWRRRGHVNILVYVVNIPSRLKQGWVFVLGHRLSRHLPLFWIDMGVTLAWREGPPRRRSPSKSFTLHTCFNPLGSARYPVKVLTRHPSQLSTQTTLTRETPL